MSAMCPGTISVVSDDKGLVDLRRHYAERILCLQKVWSLQLNRYHHHRLIILASTVLAI